MTNNPIDNLRASPPVSEGEVGEIATLLLNLSRELPTRACSPYGERGVDYEEIKRISRKGYEALRSKPAPMVVSEEALAKFIERFRFIDGDVAMDVTPAAARACAEAMYAAIPGLGVRAPTWQTMDSAPKDGKDILITTAGIGMLVRIGFWDEALGGRWSTWPGRAQMKPTHWRPLPSPPDREGV